MSQSKKIGYGVSRLTPFILTCLAISPALLFVSMNLSWDAVLFLIIYTALSVWVVQILNADQLNK
ncbi:hypothetical protein [Providencia heimbachae]|uniref:hypothetical protein n=1 Tax=Providencia heimbachae TaxID=333962 RepID=UPI0022400CD5|nr:hypothetical protein [Providencia heimbachae]